MGHYGDFWTFCMSTIRIGCDQLLHLLMGFQFKVQKKLVNGPGVEIFFVTYWSQGQKWSSCFCIIIFFLTLTVCTVHCTALSLFLLWPWLILICTGYFTDWRTSEISQLGAVCSLKAYWLFLPRFNSWNLTISVSLMFSNKTSLSYILQIQNIWCIAYQFSIGRAVWVCHWCNKYKF